jgi:SPP1 family predicted phage head-tail adaptor
MNAGSLRKRLIIQASTDTQSASGAYTKTWATLATVWANVVQTSGMTEDSGGSVHADKTYTVTIRYYSGVTPKNRLLWGSRILNIDSVINLEEKNHWMVMVCREAI